MYTGDILKHAQYVVFQTLCTPVGMKYIEDCSPELWFGP